MSDYIHKTPHKQSYHNDEGNKAFDLVVRLGISKIIRFLNAENGTVMKCAHAFVKFICHVDFPSCEGTNSEYKEQKICRETCLVLIRICGWKIWNFVVKNITNNNPEDPEIEKFIRCKIQPFRNAGDSQECWYCDLEESAGNIKMG